IRDRPRLTRGSPRSLPDGGVSRRPSPTCPGPPPSSPAAPRSGTSSRRSSGLGPARRRAMPVQARPSFRRTGSPLMPGASAVAVQWSRQDAPHARRPARPARVGILTRARRAAMILPIGHEETSLKRLPWVSFTIMALCIVAFLLTGRGSPAWESTAGAHARELAEYFMEHPYLELDARGQEV